MADWSTMRKTLAKALMPAEELAGDEAVIDVTDMHLVVALGQEAQHAVGADRLRIAAAGLGHGMALGAALGHLEGGALALGVRVEGQDDDDHAADHRQDADAGMDHEAADEEDRHEGHVEQGRRAQAREEAADRVEVPDRLHALGLAGRP